jgi:hypothetical protein
VTNHENIFRRGYDKEFPEDAPATPPRGKISPLEDPSNIISVSIKEVRSKDSKASLVR